MGPDGQPTGLVAVRGRSLRLLIVALLVLAPAGAHATPASSELRTDEDGPVRLSLPTESDRVAWRKAGFRLQLGATFGELHGLGGAPRGLVYGVLLRIGMRLDERWSMLGSLQYALASAPGGLEGVRFMGTLEPTWHVSPHVSLAFGLGFAGLVERTTGRADPDPLASTLDTSYTFVDSRNPLPRCSGIGVAALTRADYTIVLGSRSSMGLALELSGQWTACVEDSGRVEPDIARPIVRRQWWPHLGGTVAWFVGWR
jgi:hypothetical protein